MTKGRAPVALRTAGIAAAFVQPLLACMAYVPVAIVWRVPDRRLEKALGG